MDIRKIKKLIELLEESGIAEIEIKEGEEGVRISRMPPGGHAGSHSLQGVAHHLPIAAPVQLPPPHQPGAPAAVSPKPNRSSSVRWIAALAGVVVVAAAVTLFRAHQSPPPQPVPASQPAPTLQPAPAPQPASTPEPAPTPKPVATANPVDLSSLAGRWRDPVERDADSLVILLISGSSGDLTIQAYGTCKPKLCDWGTEQAVVDGQSATATFKVPNLPGRKGEDRVASVRVSPSGSNLDVQVHNTFRVGDQPRTSGIHQVFLPVHH